MPDLRSLPSVDQVLRRLPALPQYPQTLITSEVRAVLEARRKALLRGDIRFESEIDDEVVERLSTLAKPSLRRVINATGVILHTNLGRASLGEFHPIKGWSNLEYDLETGRRGKRDVHTAGLLEKLLNRAAIVVNNNAAAVYLVLHELAQGKEVIVSRGELIEIGDGFRIPDIMHRSGAVLKEVGTTNRTRVEDYRSAISPQTSLIMRVHPSNFHISGFTSRPTFAELCEIGRQAGVPVYEDLGSGCLVDLRSAGVKEPLVKDSLLAGADVVSFSCDKLLGGPQSGIIAGNGDLVMRVRRNAMYRAFRVDKLVIEALEKTLRALVLERWEEIPTLRAILSLPGELKRKAMSAQALLAGARVEESESPIGGGSTPDQALPTWLVRIAVPKPDQFLTRLRMAASPVIARISEGDVVLDLRTVADDEVDELIRTVSEELSAGELPHDVAVDHGS